MPSYPRYMILKDKSLFHATWQCHNNDFYLKRKWAQQKYYDLLIANKDKYQVTLISFNLMDSHPHITGYIEEAVKLSNFFKTVNSQFARFYNKRTNRRGQVVMDRFKSPIIESQSELLKVMYYIDLNQKRAFVNKHPKDNEFSSFQHYAYGKEEPLITDPQCYIDLGETPEERQEEYLRMVEYILAHDWKDKKNYSNIDFIGNPDWVKMRYFQIKAEVARRRELKKKKKPRPPNEADDNQDQPDPVLKKSKYKK